MKPHRLVELDLRACASDAEAIFRCLILFGMMITGLQPVKAQSYVRTLSHNGSSFINSEHLKYKVAWNFISLGVVETSQVKRGDSSNVEYYITSRARSTTWLPFVHVNVIDSAILRPALPSNVWFHFVDSKSKSWAIYSHDSGSTVLFMKGVENGKDTVTSSLKGDAPCYDALGYLMLIRTLSGSGRDLTVPVIVDYKLKPTEIIFHRQVEAVKVPAFKEPILAHRFETKGDWSDPYSGGTGANMTGWISADSAAVPLLIKMKILVGSINVELESCARPGWIPPTTSHPTEFESAENRQSKLPPQRY